MWRLSYSNNNDVRIEDNIMFINKQKITNPSCFFRILIKLIGSSFLEFSNAEQFVIKKR